jgi:hypothetical protein
VVLCVTEAVASMAWSSRVDGVGKGRGRKPSRPAPRRPWRPWPCRTGPRLWLLVTDKKRSLRRSSGPGQLTQQRAPTRRLAKPWPRSPGTSRRIAQRRRLSPRPISISGLFGLFLVTHARGSGRLSSHLDTLVTKRAARRLHRPPMNRAARASSPRTRRRLDQPHLRTRKVGTAPVEVNTFLRPTRSRATTTVTNELT